MRTKKISSIVPRIGAALLGCALAAGCATSGGTGRRAPDFALRDLSGKNIQLSDYLGKDVILISFWATWCVPCVGEMPHLDRLYQTYGDQGFVVLSVSIDGPESVAQVAPTVRRLGVTFPVILDEETRVVQLYNPRREAPFSVMIDRRGVIVSQKVGYSPGDEVALEKEIQALLAAPQPGT